MYKNISYGIILVKLPFDISFEDFSFDKNNIPKISYKNKEDIEKFSLFSDKIEFLLVQRSHSYEYGTLIMNKYQFDNIQLLKYMFQQMTPNEINNIITKNFDDLWKEYWKEEEINPNFQKVYQNSKETFNQLKTKKIKGKSYFDIFKEVKSRKQFTEWGFPKGKKNNNESDIETAIREFKEETDIDTSKIKIYENILLEETFIGSDGKRYFYKYFLATTTDDINPKINQDNKTQIKEISNIRFINYNELSNLIETNYIDRLTITTFIFNFIMNKLINFTFVKTIKDGDKKE